LNDRRIRVAVVVPAFNEGLTIGPLLRGLPRDSAEIRYRTFVCNDGSTDGTEAAALAAGATVLRHSRNLGIGAALTTGFEAALRWPADILVQIDADGQHDPLMIPQLLEPILRGEAEYAVGSRFLAGAVGWNPVRRVGVRFYSLLVKFLTGLPITDVTSGFRAFRAEAYDQLAIQSERNWAVEATLRVGLGHLRLVQVSTPYLPRLGGNSQFDFRRLFLIYHFRTALQIFRAYTASPVARPDGARGSAPSQERLSLGLAAQEHPPVPRMR
jgi:glycosyltransferase involved in cell wall biosynthesis